MRVSVCVGVSLGIPVCVFVCMSTPTSCKNMHHAYKYCVCALWKLYRQ